MARAPSAPPAGAAFAVRMQVAQRNAKQGENQRFPAEEGEARSLVRCQ